MIGTTGWQPHEAAIRHVVADAGSGVVAAPNFSTGVVLFEAIVARAAALLARQREFGAWLHEAHHATKKDAPSGTALLLKRAMEEAGFTAPIDVSSTRAGSIPGIHTIGFDGPAESITLSHTARDRSAFARGALVAARVGEGPARLVHDARRAGADVGGLAEARQGRASRQDRLEGQDSMRTNWTGVGTALVTPFTRPAISTSRRSGGSAGVRSTPAFTFSCRAGRRARTRR